MRHCLLSFVNHLCKPILSWKEELLPLYAPWHLLNAMTPVTVLVCKCRLYKTPMLLASAAVGPLLSPKCKNTSRAGSLQVDATMAAQACCFCGSAVKMILWPCNDRLHCLLTIKGNGESEQLQSGLSRG